uniref:Uncharacterized protein n=1 Tax=Oryza sativa subsp. japonica TaxID=39947 RepID=Q654I2_ORYSJ|nr:hypothetical protein [Oryza sativa Japonica Group]
MKSCVGPFEAEGKPYPWLLPSVAPPKDEDANLGISFSPKPQTLLCKMRRPSTPPTTAACPPTATASGAACCSFQQPTSRRESRSGGATAGSVLVILIYVFLLHRHFVLHHAGCRRDQLN